MLFNKKQKETLEERIERLSNEIQVLEATSINMEETRDYLKNYIVTIDSDFENETDLNKIIEYIELYSKRDIYKQQNILNKLKEKDESQIDKNLLKETEDKLNVDIEIYNEFLQIKKSVEEQELKNAQIKKKYDELEKCNKQAKKRGL